VVNHQQYRELAHHVLASLSFFRLFPVPAVGARPSRREPATEHIVNADPSEPSHAHSEARADRDGALRQRERMGMQALAEGLPPADTRTQESERGAHVPLLLRRQVAHDATAVSPTAPGKLGSTPSSC